MLRFSDRDLLMRYHWGTGVGHLHAHQPLSNDGSISDEPIDIEDDQNADNELGEHASSIDGTSRDSVHKSDNSEWDWEDVETDIENDLDYRDEYESENEDEDVGM